MKKLCKSFALVLALVMILQIMPMTAKAEDQANERPDTLYVFDLETFLETLPNSKVRYDYLKLATALQGLVNRDTPQLYFYFLDGDEAKKVNWDMDKYWLEELSKDNAYLDGCTQVRVPDFWSLFTTFADDYNGIVLWDENVPATANVASTIAGVENLLPVRYATGADDLYTAMLTKGFAESDVKRNLVGMFTGTGTIPGSATASTGSAKNDAYIWAKEQYLDTGKTNPLLMTYSIDGSSWNFDDEGSEQRNAKFISAAIPATMRPNEIVPISVTVENTGTETWRRNTSYRLGLTKYGTFGFYNDAEGTSGVTSNRDRLAVTSDVAPGERYTFAGYLKAPEAAGFYDLGMGMILDGVEWFGKKYFPSIRVAEDAGNTEKEAPEETPVACEPVEDKSGFNAMIVSAAIPDRMAPGEIVKVKFTVKNTGTQPLYCSPNNSNGQKIGLQNSAPFKLCTAADGTSTDSGSLNRIKIKTRTASEETYTIECYLKAPDAAGSYSLQLQAVDESAATKVGWFGSRYEKTITVTDTPAETPISGVGIVYDNLFNTALPNADYYIANKAFFWDLSPDDSIAPIDDRTQPVGTDVATLRKLLLSQAKQAEAAAAKGNGTGFYTVGGFVPWTLKYTPYADPKSNMDGVTPEFTMVEIISTYHGQTDADAYGTVGLSNASVFSHVPLNDELRQNNDKGASSAVTYEEDTAYLLFYMGDWDGAAWVNGIMPFIWKESQEDAAAHPDDPLPLAWPINACLADRIPQMYNMLYSTAGATDYFVTGDNGTGYLNPMFLEGSYVPEGLDDYLDEWVAHNIAANEKFDLDITGFLIEGNLSGTSGCTETVRQAYSRMTPFGVVASNRYDNIVNGDVTTPFPAMASLPNMRTDEQRQQAAKQIAGNIKFDGQFFVYRSVKASRANVRETLSLLEAQNPGIKYEVVDPYTFMKLYAQHADFGNAHTGAVYEAQKTATPITVDGTVDAGEWDEAETMVVSATSRQVSNHGYVWGTFAGEEDLTATYRLAWDSENLYMLEERVDNYWKPAYTVGANPLYDIDATMLFLDLDGVRDATKFFTGDFAIHYSFDAEGTPVVYLRTGTENGNKNHTLLNEGDVRIARTATSDGYICEMAIPWSLLTNESFHFTPEVGKQVGMTVLAIDHDDLTSGGRQIMWHGNGDTQDNWGVLKFVTSEPKTHNVQLSDIYVGEIGVEEGTDYTFRVKDGENYRYDTPTATVGAEAAAVIDHGDGSYTICNVIGDIVITGSRTPKSYRVTFTGNAGAEVADGAATATYGTDYVFTLPSAEHYSYTLTGIQANSTGNAVAYTKNALGKLTIAGSHIRDDMTITIDKERTDPPAATVKTGDSNGNLLMLAAIGMLSLLLLAVLGRIVWVSRNGKNRT